VIGGFTYVNLFCCYGISLEDLNNFDYAHALGIMVFVGMTFCFGLCLILTCAMSHYL
jgi:hypothetical protein